VAVDFRLDDGQLAWQDTVRRFAAARAGVERVHQWEARPLDPDLWRGLAELGVLGLVPPEPSGGGVVEAVLAFEQLGAHLVPGPVLWSALAAPLLDGVADGNRTVGGIDAPGDAEGDPVLVAHGAEVDTLVVLRADGVYACARTDAEVYDEPEPLDPLTPIARVDALPEGDRIGTAVQAAWLGTVGTALAAATLLGVADVALEISRRYALEREQFGVPIGSFQAIKHLLADMYVRTGMARSATYAAGAVLDDPEAGDPARATSAAKVLAGSAAIENSRTAVQVHGGMGFTWDMPPHALLKRAWVLEQSFGTGDAHALALATSLDAA
jgi:alkylation response protein AidB-like acyl-CoA dehydrogenase